MNLNRLIKLCFASITFDLLSIQAPGIISAELTACMQKDVYVCIQQKRFRYCPFYVCPHSHKEICTRMSAINMYLSNLIRNIL